MINNEGMINYQESGDEDQELLPAAITPRPVRDERGMTTAEYAVGTVAAVSFAGVLLKVLTNPQVSEALIGFITALIKLFTDLKPFG